MPRGRPKKKIVEPEIHELLKPVGWDNMTGKDKENFLCANFPDVKKLLEG